MIFRFLEQEINLEQNKKKKSEYLSTITKHCKISGNKSYDYYEVITKWSEKM